MTDRELLELAAKAAGYKVLRPDGDFLVLDTSKHPDCVSPYWWTPLTDDGDALRLAATRSMDVLFMPGGLVRARTISHRADEPYRDDTYSKAAAIRRAIVRAAAEIGRAA